MLFLLTKHEAVNSYINRKEHSVRGKFVNTNVVFKNFDRINDNFYDKVINDIAGGKYYKSVI